MMTDLMDILRASRTKQSAYVSDDLLQEALRRGSQLPVVGSILGGAQTLGNKGANALNSLLGGSTNILSAAVKKDMPALAGSTLLGKAAYGLGMGGAAIGAPYLGYRALKGEPPPEVIPAEYNPRSYVPSATY